MKEATVAKIFALIFTISTIVLALLNHKLHKEIEAMELSPSYSTHYEGFIEGTKWMGETMIRAGRCK